jgi:hypothetical protein
MEAIEKPWMSMSISYSHFEGQFTIYVFTSIFPRTLSKHFLQFFLKLFLNHSSQFPTSIELQSSVRTILKAIIYPVNAVKVV